MASPFPQAEDPCPLCRGTGWQLLPAPPAADGAPAQPRATRCPCQAAHRGSEIHAAAQIPPRYEHCTLENFLRPPGAHPSLQAAHLQAAAYAKDYPVFDYNRPSGLLFYGSVGSGKTHLAVAIAQRLLERGFACRFCDYRDLLKQVQATFDPANPATEAGVVGPLLAVEVLVLDDLGVGRATEWAVETLHYILNHRYSQQLATILTTNLTDGDPGARLGEGGEFRRQPALAEVIGERLRSRLYEMCTLVPLHGDDHRRQRAVSAPR